MDNYSFLNTAHTAYFADLYDQYLQDPDKVEPSWRAFFQVLLLIFEVYQFSLPEFQFFLGLYLTS